MPALVRDSFAGADGTAITARLPEVGARGWQYKVGAANLVVGGGRLRCEATTERIATIAVPSTANYHVDGDFYTTSLLAADEGGVVGRFLDLSNYYLAHYRSAAGQWQLWRRVAGVFTLLGSYAQTLTAATHYVAQLVMESSRITLYVDGVKLVEVTDTALTAAGEAGVRFVPGTAHTPTTGMQLEGVQVGTSRRVDTCAVSSGSNLVSAGKKYSIATPRTYLPQSKRGLIYLGGAGSGVDTNYPYLAAYANAGLPTITGDYWGGAVGWGNQAAMDLMRASWNRLKAHHGAKADKVLLVGVSGGGGQALNFARTYPSEVAAIVLTAPAVNFDDLHDRNVEGLAPVIEACYGGTLASWNAAEPTWNPYWHLAQLEGIPIYVFKSDTDTLTLPTFQQALIDQVVSASGESVGNWGHHGGVTSFGADAAVEFLLRYASE